MQKSVVCCVVVVLVLCILGTFGQPSPPKMPNIYNSSLEVYTGNQTNSVTYYIADDYVTDVDWYESTGIEVYCEYKQKKCWTVLKGKCYEHAPAGRREFPQDFLLNSTYLGTAQINGVACYKWSGTYHSDEDFSVIYYESQRTLLPVEMYDTLGLWKMVWTSFTLSGNFHVPSGCPSTN